MLSATDFLPSSMTLFMNFDRVRSPNLGSGRMTRFSGRRRRDIGLFLSLQPGPEYFRGLLAYFVIPAKAGIHLDPGLRRGSSTLARLFGALGAVLGPALAAVLHTLGVK